MQIFYCNDTKEINVIYRGGLPFVSKGSLPKNAVIVATTALLPAKVGDNFLRGKDGTTTVSYAVELNERKTSWYIPVGNHKYIAVTGKLPKDTATAAMKESTKKEPVVKEPVKKKEIKAKAEKPVKERKEKKEKPVKEVKEKSVSDKEQDRKERKGIKPWLIVGIVCLSVLLVVGGGLFIKNVFFGRVDQATALLPSEIKPGEIINRLRETNKPETTSQNSLPVEKIEDSEQMEQLIEQNEAEDVSLKELGIRLPSSISLQDGELVVENEKEGRYLSYNFYQEDVLLVTSDMLPSGRSFTLSLSQVKEGKLKVVIDVYDEATFDLIGSSEKVIKIKK